MNLCDVFCETRQRRTVELEAAFTLFVFTLHKPNARTLMELLENCVCVCIYEERNREKSRRLKNGFSDWKRQFKKRWKEVKYSDNLLWQTYSFGQPSSDFIHQRDNRPKSQITRKYRIKNGGNEEYLSKYVAPINWRLFQKIYIKRQRLYISISRLLSLL